jgi:probable phosphoglycerate mutase
LRLALVRHGPTLWNAQGRIQGKTDIPLSEEGVSQMARLRLPQDFSSARAFVSPLQRARQTAALLGIENPVIDARLAEHDWGDWEGLTREEILARDGPEALSHAGLNLHPPGGESTRTFVARVDEFLGDVVKGEGDAVAVTHRGVLRAAYAIASGWNMATPMPAGLDLSKMLVLSLKEGNAAIARIDVPLEER